MSCHTPTLDALRTAGLRLTPQRVMIAEALHHLGGHVTAEQVLEHVQRQHPYVDLSTVYRTLETFSELALVRGFTPASGPTEFELASEPHHHLVCTQCGHVAPLPAGELASLVSRIAERHGFHADLQHLAIAGRCAGCAAGP